ncbi:MAG: 2-dehydropantoate 2-reductase [Acidobacteria bacterium]|jgi:2-dehydropantoate 2-reductase|nr:2-dehydropantoate 2-reductase [Acidobacteriota bacterium]
MKIAIMGAGAVGGYYGALLARVGADVSFVARGAHRDAIRANGLRIIGVQGDFTVKVAAEDNPDAIGPVDVVIVAVKTYDNDTVFPLVKPLMGAATTVLTLQNGVDSADDLARVVGEDAVIAGPTYIATAIDGPGVIRQTGSRRRIVFGEVFRPGADVSARVRALADLMLTADIHAEPVADARIPLWEKFIYLAPFAAFTGAARLPIGPVWADEESRAAFMEAVREVERVARASGISVAEDVAGKIETAIGEIPASTRSSLLIDLSVGKRIEVESLLGSVIRRGRALGVDTPLMRALYGVLRPHAEE